MEMHDCNPYHHHHHEDIVYAHQNNWATVYKLILLGTVTLELLLPFILKFEYSLPIEQVIGFSLLMLFPIPIVTLFARDKF